METKGALAGITVLDLSRLLPGPYATMILADHGARVINIEDRRFEAEGLMVGPVCRNKEHVALDLKTGAGREIFLQLAARADVVLEGFRPGVVARLGVDYPAVRRVNPEIVYCSLTGYGQTGPLRDQAGHDVNYLARSGVLDLMGAAGGPPLIPGIPMADLVGGIHAALGVLLALFARERTGRGQAVDVSMTDGMLALLPVALLMRQWLGQAPPRGDGMLSHRYACYNVYETADGRHITVGCVENRFWRRLCDFLGVPEFVPLQYDEARRQEVIDHLRHTFRQKPLEAWAAALTPLDACCAPVRSVEEALHDPHFRERRMVTEVPGPGGERQLALGVPIQLGGTPGAIRTPPVGFGENTIAILKELGYGAEEIDQLARQGII
jgi:crotonobetainyl-CoA:carnitine CoA-transferase CaiB-like acyl-CoA transferase